MAQTRKGAGTKQVARTADPTKKLRERLAVAAEAAEREGTHPDGVDELKTLLQADAKKLRKAVLSLDGMMTLLRESEPLVQVAKSRRERTKESGDGQAGEGAL